jgi:YD repeat-containing protein
MFGRGWGFSYESMINQVGEDILLRKGSGQRLSYRPGSPANRQSPKDPIEAVSLHGGYDRLLDYGRYWLFIEKDTRLTYRYGKLAGTNTSRLTAITDLNGNTAQVRYSADGMIQSITDAAGRSTSFSYDHNERCVSFTLPDSRTANFSYDDQGSLANVKDLFGIVTVYKYDAGQYMTRMIVGRDLKTTTFAYQNSGQGKYINAVTDAGGNTTRYEMVSANPRQIRVIDPEGRITAYHSTEGLTGRIADPLGNSILYSYARRLRVSVQNRNGQTYRMEYDARSNITRLTDPLGNSMSWVYDDYDNLISETFPQRENWSLTYDGKHNLTRVTSPMGRAMSLEYDSKGQIVAIADAAGNKSTLVYDEFGNMVTFTNSLGNINRMSYDPYGLTMTETTDARGNTTQYEYDENNRLTKETQSDGSTRVHSYDCCVGIATIDENGHKTTFRRDPLLMIREWINGMGNSTLYSYDRSNLPVNVRDALGRILTFGYDDAGRPIQWTNPMRGTGSLRRDPEGNLISLYDERGMETTLGYDANNLQTRISDPLGLIVNITRDALGRLSIATNARGGKVALSYDADGQITEKSYDGVKFAVYEYDAAGNLINMIDATGTTRYKYDAANQVTSVRYPDGLEANFSYDEAGNVSAITYPGGLVVRYTYDNRNRLARVAWGENSISYRHDAVGNVMSEARSNGTESVYAYNANDQFAEIKHQRGTEAFAHLIYTYNAVGNITNESSTLPLEPVLTNVGEPTTYNAANQIVNRGADTYTYDADGNLTGSLLITFTEVVSS